MRPRCWSQRTLPLGLLRGTSTCRTFPSPHRLSLLAVVEVVAVVVVAVVVVVVVVVVVMVVMTVVMVMVMVLVVVMSVAPPAVAPHLPDRTLIAQQVQVQAPL